MSVAVSVIERYVKEVHVLVAMTDIIQDKENLQYEEELQEVIWHLSQTITLMPQLRMISSSSSTSNHGCVLGFGHTLHKDTVHAWFIKG